MKRKKVLFIFLGIAIISLGLLGFHCVYFSLFTLSFTPSEYQNNEIFDVLIEDIVGESFENNIIDFQNKTKKCKTFPTKLLRESNFPNQGFANGYSR